MIDNIGDKLSLNLALGRIGSLIKKTEDELRAINNVYPVFYQNISWRKNEKQKGVFRIMAEKFDRPLSEMPIDKRIHLAKQIPGLVKANNKLIKDTISDVARDVQEIEDEIADSIGNRK